MSMTNTSNTFTTTQQATNDAILDAIGACPFDSSTEATRWDLYHGYLENAAEADSLDLYEGRTVVELTAMATEHALDEDC